MSAVTRGLRNPFRTRVRTSVVVLLLAIIIGLFAVMVQGASFTRQKLGDFAGADRARRTHAEPLAAMADRMLHLQDGRIGA